MPKTKTEELPVWKQPPHIGEKWVRKTTHAGQEQRTVVERTLGGHVNYIVGRWTRFSQIFTVTLEHWQQWQSRAVRKK